MCISVSSFSLRPSSTATGTMHWCCSWTGKGTRQHIKQSWQLPNNFPYRFDSIDGPQFLDLYHFFLQSNGSKWVNAWMNKARYDHWKDQILNYLLWTVPSTKGKIVMRSGGCGRRGRNRECRRYGIFCLRPIRLTQWKWPRKNGASSFPTSVNFSQYHLRTLLGTGKSTVHLSGYSVVHLWNAMDISHSGGWICCRLPSRKIVRTRGRIWSLRRSPSSRRRRLVPEHGLQGEIVSQETNYECDNAIFSSFRFETVRKYWFYSLTSH